MKYKILDWDTSFFGIKIGEITEPLLNIQELNAVLHELRLKETKLVYWSSDKEIYSKQATALSCSLVDKKITLTMSFETIDFNKTVSVDIVERFTEPTPIHELESLAVLSGEHSRFFTDLNFPKDKARSLYKTWIRKSLQKEIASEVLLIRNYDESVVGMITLGEKNGIGDIGLISVDANFRGNSYGEKLVRASQRWFMENGYKHGQVVTQEINIPALNLYKKCGYSIEKIEYFYHIWI